MTNRARLLDVARMVFAERGLDMEVGEIAQRANLSIGTLYRHFANRDELLRTVVFDVLHDSLEQFYTALGPIEDDPRASLLAFLSVGLRVQEDYGPLFAILRDPRLGDIFDQNEMQSFRDQFLALPLGILERGIKAGLFLHDLDQEIAATTIIGSISGVSDFLQARWPQETLALKLFRLHLVTVTGKTEE
jgi:AcrR family transcriptional regulator